MANLAQLVNVIAPIRTEPGGGAAWRQSTFHPFALTAKAASGRVVLPRVDGAVIDTARHGSVDAVDAVATVDGSDVSVFLAHRDLDAATEVELDLGAVEQVDAVIVTIPEGGDRHTANSADGEPVAPAPLAVEAGADGILRFTLPALAWVRLTARLTA